MAPTAGPKSRAPRSRIRTGVTVFRTFWTSLGREEAPPQGGVDDPQERRVPRRAGQEAGPRGVDLGGIEQAVAGEHAEGGVVVSHRHAGSRLVPRVHHRRQVHGVETPNGQREGEDAQSDGGRAGTGHGRSIPRDLATMAAGPPCYALPVIHLTLDAGILERGERPLSFVPRSLQRWPVVAVVLVATLAPVAASAQAPSPSSPAATPPVPGRARPADERRRRPGLGRPRVRNGRSVPRSRRRRDRGLLEPRRPQLPAAPRGDVRPRSMRGSGDEKTGDERRAWPRTTSATAGPPTSPPSPTRSPWAPRAGRPSSASSASCPSTTPAPSRSPTGRATSTRTAASTSWRWARGGRSPAACASGRRSTAGSTATISASRCQRPAPSRRDRTPTSASPGGTSTWASSGPPGRA